MRLVKKINNNVALGVDGEGRDVVVFGKGVGFRRMPYELEDTAVLERVFRDVNKTIAASLASISDDILLAASDIVDFAHMELDSKLNPNLPFTLADHIQFAIQRHDEGLDLTNPLADEVAFVYPHELRVARTGVAMINKRVARARLPEAEAFAIALHLVNGEAVAKGDRTSLHVVMESARILSAVTDIIEECSGTTLDHESYAYHRFTAHFRFLVARLIDENNQETPTKNTSLFEQAAQDFPEVYGCVRKIADYLEQNYQWSCSNEELLYLMMHLNRLMST